MLDLFFFGEFFLHISCWLFIFLIREVSFTHLVLASFLSGEFLLHIPCWLHLLCGEFLLHIPCWLYFSVESFSYTFDTGILNFFFFFKSGEFPLHTPCWIHFYLGSFSYTSRAGLIFIRVFCFKHPVLASFLFGEFLLHIPCWFLSLSREFILHIPYWLYFDLGSFSYTSHACIASSGRFSYTSRADFIFIWGLSLTHPVLVLFLSG